MPVVQRGALPGWVTDAAAVQFGGGRARLLANAYVRAILLSKRGRHTVHGQGWQILLEVDELMNIVSRAERDWTCARAVSGAGPSVLVLSQREEADKVVRRAPRGWVATAYEVDALGAQVLRV